MVSIEENITRVETRLNKLKEEEETIKQDKPSRLAARKTLIKNLNKVKDENGNNVDLPGKMLNELAEKYANIKGGYTRIVKLGKRRGDAAEEVVLQLI